MIKSKKTLTKFIAAAAVMLAVVTVPAGCCPGDDRMDSGVPDVISTRTQNEKCSLTVVANSGEIRDREAFARTVIKMYETNDFQTTKFSRDGECASDALYYSISDKKGRGGRKSGV